MPDSDMWQDCQITFQHTRPCYAKSSYRSVDPQTLHGNVNQVDHVPNGPTNSAAITTMFPLRLCGGKLLVAVTRERRYGPSRLRFNDDDTLTVITSQNCNYRWVCTGNRSRCSRHDIDRNGHRSGRERSRRSGNILRCYARTGCKLNNNTYDAQGTKVCRQLFQK